MSVKTKSKDSDSMLIRVQTPLGLKRFTINETDTFKTLLDVIDQELGSNEKGNERCLSLTRNKVDSFRGNSKILSNGIKNGDLIYLLESMPGKKHVAPSNRNVEFSATDSNSGSTVMDSESSSQAPSWLRKADDVDQILVKRDGQIKRKRNEQLCHHPPSGKCVHCVPLEPFDTAYLEHLDPPVKFMSFHTYLRKLNGGQAKGKFTTLENLSYRVRPGCREHPPWPDGICTKCQPNPVTLEIQPYRHVDFVQFENAQIVETFLDYWRQTGMQRVGIMLGRYAPFDVPGAPPLAVKATVAAIYEPSQESTNRSIKLTAALDQLLPKHAEEVIDRLGLRPIGWIFTDLVASTDPELGQVKHYRGSMDTFFLTAEECITAAHLQTLYPNVCTLSSDGRFGSKFVTVVVTGDDKNQIHFEAYQVSNQAMALERDGLLIPTYDAPELGYIRETTKETFRPEVFYSKKDKYGNKVTQIARPLPVEYLLVKMPAAFPITPMYTFAKQPDNLPEQCRFPVENRQSLGQIQCFPQLARRINYFGTNRLWSCLVNFHVLVWLAGYQDLPLHLPTNPRTQPDVSGSGPCDMHHLLDAICNAHKSAAGNGILPESSLDDWAATCPAWTTILTTSLSEATDVIPPSMPTTGRAVQASPMDVDPSAPPEPNQTNSFWSCSQCTFHNPLTVTDCDMCGLPK